ncbi:TPA: hypothetical protein MJA57_00065 [Klebsiella pneumoniae]|nr:hypothetical protein [Klebsiella pneumoniae]
MTKYGPRIKHIDGWGAAGTISALTWWQNPQKKETEVAELARKRKRKLQRKSRKQQKKNKGGKK